MTNEKTLVDVLEEISTKRDFIFTLTEVIRELTENATESNFKTRGNGIEDKMFSIGYELNRVHDYIANLHNMIYSLDREMNDLITKATKMAMDKY
ncbi:hypothetical protein ACTQ5F_07975 [Jeotgalibaca porci]|uniref:hypothetical protein n=1 Tax=Jeotgalibaca porci TaxID=1868793 RepID=UPI003F91ABE8